MEALCHRVSLLTSYIKRDLGNEVNEAALGARKAAELRSFVKVEVAVPNTVTILMVTVDV